MDLEDKLTYNENILMSVYKFEEDVIKEIKSLTKNGVNKKKLLTHIKSIKKKPISHNIIVLFYEQPTQFFNDYNISIILSNC